MAEIDDAEALRLTTNLVQFLAEITENAARSPIRDVVSDHRTGPKVLVWLDDLPESVKVADQPDGVLLRLGPRPVSSSQRCLKSSLIP
ncbi:hypothetical protein [Nocardia wallacei]|uniref:hypothetical protein n=1 Tax=Nocardia wallacei TaxID=480035 RepID=UPI0024585A7B|nr:hypothetical protein [Nocardia wallacei]